MLDTTPTKEYDASPRSDAQRRIVEAAGQIFADSGYKHTTIRTICRQAGVNVAAVNYYFGGKKNLYLAVLKALRVRVLEKHPMELDGHATRPPDERLYVFIRTFLSRILDEEEGARFAKLMAQELIQPTDAFDQIIEEIINPSFAFLSATVLQLFKKPMSKEKTGLCCLSIVGQIFYFYMSKHVIRKLFDREHFGEWEIDAVANHITRFSLYAIDRMAEKNEGDVE
jgi:AcrR family transcriptional regulator